MKQSEILTMNDQMNAAVNELIEKIRVDYFRFLSRMGDGPEPSPFAQQQMDNFYNDIEVAPGSKYIKIIRERCVWGFIVNTDNDKKFKRGDILKAAGWAAPARNKARGNILEKDFSWVQWTGPAYL
jgi:hypothetical protein